MKINELNEDGVITAYNTTVDVKPGETERQAKKFFGGDGKPKPLGVKGATPNQAFNLGLSENMSVTGTETRQAEKKKGIKVGTPEWFKHWFDLPYLREDITKNELLAKLKDQQRGRYISAMLDAMHKLVTSKGSRHSIGGYAFEVAKTFGFNSRDLEKMYRDMYDIPQDSGSRRYVEDSINESLDNPYPYTLEGPSETGTWVGKANTLNGPLVMDFDGNNSQDDFSIDFAVNSKMGNEGTGDAFRIFATVMAIMDEWIANVGIERVVSFDFNADKDEHDSDGRSRLYTRYANKLAKQLGWSLRKSEVGNGSADFFSLQNPTPQKNENFANGKKKEIKTKKNPDGFTIDLIVDGKQVGQYTHAREDDIVRNQAEIFPEYRDKGYGTMLLLAAIKTADDLGLDFEEDTQSLTPAMSRIYDELDGSGMIYGGNGAWAISPSGEDELEDFLNENFADGKVKGKSRPGRVKRSGASCDGSVTDLRAKAKKASGEKAKMYHWCANMKSEDVTQSQLNSLEKIIDKAFGHIGIDVEFTRHFIDRANDDRNGEPITIQELGKLFAKEYKRWGKPIAQLGPDQEAVMKDLESDINIPFVLRWNGSELEMIAKTVMRKKNFRTMNKQFPVENAPNTLGHQINWGGKNKPTKPTQSNVAVNRGTQNPQNWWQTMLAKGKGMFEDDIEINKTVDKVGSSSVYSNSTQTLGEDEMLTKQLVITPELAKLNNIFNRGGYEIRVVGGAVRDLALDKEPKDIDLATDATPTEMQKMFDSAGVRHIPTGIEHGTITAVINGEEFEITTLRADVETDGRRAEVEFVKSWEEDAKRRDLTYNAMSMDFEGNLYDYHGGMDDLQDKVTRFVGDPEERIKEDYLRTLRYFRFQGRLDTPTFDKETMQAIANNTAGLKQLSVERVWMEMGKILGGANIKQILSAMQSTGVMNAIGLNAKSTQDIMDGGDPIINLARITDDQAVGKRWKMSNDEKSKLVFLIQNKGQTHDKKWFTDQMADGFDRRLLDALARFNRQDDMIQYIKSFKAPEFPVTGNDLMQLGHARGPGIGQTLNALRTKWKQGDFSASKDELLKAAK